MISAYRTIAATILVAGSAILAAPVTASAGPVSPVSMKLPECARFAAQQVYSQTGRYNLLVAIDAINHVCARHIKAYGDLHTKYAAQDMAMQVAMETRLEMQGAIRR